jgi:hypothetical protein
MADVQPRSLGYIAPMLRIAPVALILFGMSCSSRDRAPPVAPAPTPTPIAVADAAIAADAADADVAGRRLTAWLAMLNDGKRDAIIAFRERELSDAGRTNKRGFGRSPGIPR